MRLRPGLGLGVKNQHLGRDDESEAIEFPDPTDELGRHASFVTGSPRETPPSLLNRSRLRNEPLSPKRNANSSPRPRSLHGTEAAPLAHAMSRSSSISSLWVERSRTKTACYESRPQHWRYEGELDLSEHSRKEPVNSCASETVQHRTLAITGPVLRTPSQAVAVPPRSRRQMTIAGCQRLSQCAYEPESTS